jgi:hypothetical protein
MASLRSFAVTVALAAILLTSNIASTQESPKYKADVPASVITPDTISTRLLGDLHFFDGMPDAETVRKTYDFLDVSRAAETFLNGIPAASVYGLLEGLKQAGMKPGELGMFESLMDARSLFLTPNSTTVYCMTEINVKDGPIVVELPPGVLGPVDDAFFRFITDFGNTGPDQGKGGKYLFVHRDYKGTIPEGYFVAKTPTYRKLTFFRAFVKDGDIKATVAGLKSVYRCYPLAQASNPPKAVFHNLSGKQFNTVHANDSHFFDELNAVIQYEPADAFDPELVGLFASIGIKKGQPFNPDARMKKLLETDQKLAGVDSNSKSLKPDADGSYTVYFGPTAPAGHEGNWIQTMPGKSYNVLLRLYGPLQPWFDKTWKPGDFVLAK